MSLCLLFIEYLCIEALCIRICTCYFSIRFQHLFNVWFQFVFHFKRGFPWFKDYVLSIWVSIERTFHYLLKFIKITESLEFLNLGQVPEFTIIFLSICETRRIPKLNRIRKWKSVVRGGAIEIPYIALPGSEYLFTILINGICSFSVLFSKSYFLGWSK